MDCITISDDSSVRSERSSANATVPSIPLSIDSHTSVKCPTSWNYKQREEFSNNSTSPTTLTRVKLWLASTMHLQQSTTLSSSHSVTYENSDSGSISSFTDEYSNTKHLYMQSPKRNILIRRDFKIDEKVGSGCTYSDTKSKYSNCTMLNDVRNGNIRNTCCFNPSLEDKIKIIETKTNHKEKTETDFPLSPESQKKNELCSYLQLMNMNCSNRKLANKIQNRRSTRVKNLIIMSERKELERSLNVKDNENNQDEKDIDEIKNSQQKHTRLLSELNPENLNFKKGKNNLSRNHSKVKLFSIEDVPKNVLLKQSDFEDAIQGFINMECHTKKNKEIKKCNSKSETKKLTNKKNFKKTQNLIHFIRRTRSTSRTNPSYRTKLRNSQAKIRNKSNSMLFNYKKQRLSIRRHNCLNLRSMFSVSEVNTKNVILKNRLRSARSKITFKTQKRPKKPHALVKPTKNIDVKEPNTTKINRGCEGVPNKVEFALIENRFETRTKNVFEDTVGHKNEILPEKIANKLELNITVNDKGSNIKNIKIDTYATTNIKCGIEDKINKISSLVKISNNQDNNTDKCNSIERNTFNIIDLSHSKENIHILQEHDYAVKCSPDKGLSTDVILDESGNCLSTDSIQNLPVKSDNNGESFDDMGLCQKQEYCLEALEEIIGVPMKSSSKNNTSAQSLGPSNLNKETNYCHKSSTALSNVNNTNHVLDSNLSVEKSTFLFNEEFCSSSFHDDMHLKPTEHTVTSNRIDDKPKAHHLQVPLSKVKNLHKSLMLNRNRQQTKTFNSYYDSTSNNCKWDSDSTEDKRSHSIRISLNKGNLVNAFYLNFNLVIVQEHLISFWCQSALGNILGSQNLWISKGSLQRFVVDNNCVLRESSNMVISADNSFAYVELWIKEHKSEKRERPLADVFATLYYWKEKKTCWPSKKFLQLEKINGKCSDVQYVVLQNSRCIIVSWVENRDDTKITVVHHYSLAPDYQTVVDIREMHTVDHGVASLHNIEDCHGMIMGFGEDHVTLWNIEYGYIVATIKIRSISENPRCTWVKCDRGFLFILLYHEFERLLVLIAINGINSSWKKLQVFHAPYGYDGLRGICVDNNILAAFYQGGIVCWNIHTGEPVIEEVCSQTCYIPCDKHLVILNSEKIEVQQFLSYFITSFDLH